MENEKMIVLIFAKFFIEKVNYSRHLDGEVRSIIKVVVMAFVI